MMITKKSLSRRTLLRGAGAALSLPFLDAMMPAFASPAAKKPITRLGFVYVPNGIIDLQGEWTPTAEGAAFEFASTAKALEPFHDHILMLSGLAQVSGRALGDGPALPAIAFGPIISEVASDLLRQQDLDPPLAADRPHQLKAQSRTVKTEPWPPRPSGVKLKVDVKDRLFL